LTLPAWLRPAPVRALLALAAVLLLGCIANAGGAFFHAATHFGLLDAVGSAGILAIGQCLVILGGGIDLSVGSVLAFSGMAFAGLMLEGGWVWPLAAAAAIAAGTACGLLNGVLVARARIQPFLATLATMVIARGLARWLPELAGKDANSKFLPVEVSGPQAWQWLAGKSWLGLPNTGLLFLLVAAAATLFVKRTVAGRHLLAVGGNEEAARLAGIAVVRTKLLAYGLCGACSGLAAVCWVARDVQGNPAAGAMFELDAIAAVVIGGTSLQGGRGGIGLAVIGLFTLAYIDKVLSLNAVPDHWRLVVRGVIILAAVLLQERRR